MSGRVIEHPAARAARFEAERDELVDAMIELLEASGPFDRTGVGGEPERFELRRQRVRGYRLLVQLGISAKER